MNLTLSQAATALGKTRRQLVYMIEQGRIEAQKIGGRWYLDSRAIEQDPVASQRGQIRQANLRDAIEDALLPPDRQRRYSLLDLKAFQVAHPIYEAITEHWGPDHHASLHLHQCLEHLAQGCHRFARGEKARAYQAARDAASLAVLELILSRDDALAGTRDTLEQDLMPAIAGLLRRVAGCGAAPDAEPQTPGGGAQPGTGGLPRLPGEPRRDLAEPKAEAADEGTAETGGGPGRGCGDPQHPILSGAAAVPVRGLMRTPGRWRSDHLPGNEAPETV